MRYISEYEFLNDLENILDEAMDGESFRIECEDRNDVVLIPYKEYLRITRNKDE